MYKKQVMVEDQIFNSHKEAADYIGVDPAAIGWALSHSNKCKGLVIKSVGAEINPSEPQKGTGIVADNGKTYVSLKQLGEEINVPSHMISAILIKQGKFVHDGITYTRVAPARKVNRRSKYPHLYKENPGAAVKQVESVENAAAPVSATQVNDTIQMVKSLLKDKITECVKADEFDTAKELMDIMSRVAK